MSPAAKAEFERVGSEGARSPFVFMEDKRFSRGEVSYLRFHEEMEIKRIRSGTLSVNLGSQIVTAEAGDLVIINPYEYHSNLVSDGTAVYDMLCIDVSERFFGGVLAELFTPYREGKFRFESLIRDEAVLAAAEALFSALREGKDSAVTVARFLLFFSALAPFRTEISPAFCKGFSARQREFIFKTFSYIHEHYAESIRLSELAGQCFMTEAHLSRSFRELVGEPPIAYINRYRINRAILLLRQSALSKKEIAEQVGFSDEAYFSRAFKKYKGVSPAAYLKNGREG